MELLLKISKKLTYFQLEIHYKSVRKSHNGWLFFCLKNVEVTKKTIKKDLGIKKTIESVF
jgi:hypothetical protein